MDKELRNALDVRLNEYGDIEVESINRLHAKLGALARYLGVKINWNGSVEKIKKGKE